MSLITHYSPSIDATVYQELRVAEFDYAPTDMAVLLDEMAVPLGSGQHIYKNQNIIKKNSQDSQLQRIQF